ncbi:MAG: FAD-dependent oxidoreductase [Promethearchaeota archaeon]
MENVGAVLVVGGGIGGTQAALDLSMSGYKVYLLESSTSIGGVMAQLDKTFPTNDCSMCILSPKLVEAGRARNIDLIINAKIEKVEGEAGNFQITIFKRSLYINEEKCTGCGVCASECPVEAIDLFNEGLGKIKAISVKYPQAVPLVFAINHENCIGCGVCEGVCKAGAVEYDQEDRIIVLNVGAIILALGYDEFNPTALKQYGYGKFKNVITSIEFERILSASGPYAGKVLRPSDGDIPEKVAFLQCVGSRDCNVEKEYCSSVCCMYTAKEAVIAKEHQQEVNPTIFYMDIRAYGKDFDKYIDRAREEYGVRYIQSRISSIQEIHNTKDLKLVYENMKGEVVEEIFNMVVLAVGLDAPRDALELAKVMGISLNKFGFAQPDPLTPVRTIKQGVYVCGAFASPKDIPETVTEASAAAGEVNVLLSDARNKLIVKKEYPEEIEVQNQPPRLGVFICHCGINIGGVVDVPAVTEYASKLPNVVLADQNLYTCSADTQEIIKDKILENGLNRVVVASCTPRTHEPMFQETIREAGLNPYLFQMTNIRDQDSWVHMHEPEAATEKAKDLVRMAVAAARNLEPLQRQKIKMTKKVLVIGGGVSGLNAALAFGEQGFETYLVEREKELGGFARNIFTTLEGKNVQKYLTDIVHKVKSNDKIQIFTDTTIKSIEGYVGNFRTTVMHNPNGNESELEHGVVIVATGAKEYQPKEYMFGEDPRVILQSRFEKLVHTDPDQLKQKKTIVMIQCVGSRNAEHPYCSRVCCVEAIKNALKMKKTNPSVNIVIMFRDIRTYGFKELYYRKAREAGVVFIQFEKESYPEIISKNECLSVTVKNPKLGIISVDANLVVLSTGIVAWEENEDLAKMLKVPINDDNFFLEAHVKLRPVDFATEGVFLAGMAHAPKFIENSIAQALATVSRACIYLSKDSIEAEGSTSFVDEEICVGCGVCYEICSYNAIFLKEEDGKACVNDVLCKGCGLCAASCPEKAITIKHFTNDMILAQISALGGISQ